MNFLSKVPLFNGLSDQDLQPLLDSVMRKTYRKNTIVMTQGDTTESLYIIESGRVRVFITDEEGKEFVIAVRGPGDYLGELALIDQQPRCASVMTLETCSFLIITRESFMAWLELNPNCAIVLLQAISKRFRLLTEDTTSLALLNVYERVVRLLAADASKKEGRLVTTEMTQQDIADRIGATREMVARILRDLKEGEYISNEGRHIVIHKKLPRHW